MSEEPFGGSSPLSQEGSINIAVEVNNYNDLDRDGFKSQLHDKDWVGSIEFLDSSSGSSKVVVDTQKGNIHYRIDGEIIDGTLQSMVSDIEKASVDNGGEGINGTVAISTGGE